MTEQKLGFVRERCPICLGQLYIEKEFGGYVTQCLQCTRKWTLDGKPLTREPLDIGIILRTENWWRPRDIHYTKIQILWLIENLELLTDGVWPPECVDTGYEGMDSTYGYHASFDDVICVSAELTSRLKSTGKDGKLLVSQTTGNQVRCQEANDALRYIVGEGRKRTPYSEWIAITNYRARMRLQRY